MAIHQSHSNQNIFIPPGSAVAAVVSGTSEKVIVTASIAGPGFSPPQTAPHPEAYNNVFTAKLASSGIYVLVVDIDFLEDAVVKVHMEVRKPDGELHGVPWIFDIDGKQDDFHTASYGLGVL